MLSAKSARFWGDFELFFPVREVFCAGVAFVSAAVAGLRGALMWVGVSIRVQGQFFGRGFIPVEWDGG